MDMVVTMIRACCVFHKFCDIYPERIPLPVDVTQRPDSFVGVCRGAKHAPRYEELAVHVCGMCMLVLVTLARVGKWSS